MKKYKKLLIALAIPILIFIWGYFGFAGAWIPGKYDAEKKEYKVFWGLFGHLPSHNGTCRIYLYTPFKRQGLIDTSGKVIIPFKYRFVDFAKFDAGLIPAENLNGKYGLLNKENKIVQPFIYTNEFSCPKYAGTPDYFYYYMSEINGKKTLIDSLGNAIVPAEYSDIFMPFQNKFPYAVANKGVFSNIVFPDGKVIKKDYLITNAYYPDSKDYLIIGGVKSKDVDSKLWTIELLGLPETKNTDTVENDGNEYTSINNSNPIKQWFALYDEKGNEILPFEFDNIDWLVQGINWKKQEVVRVKKNGKFGLYNTKNHKWFLSLNYEKINLDINEKLPLIEVKKSSTDNYNYFDLNGNLILSDKATVTHIDKDLGYLYFSKNGTRYKMQYNKEKQKFTWYKL